MRTRSSNKPPADDAAMTSGRRKVHVGDSSSSSSSSSGSSSLNSTMETETDKIPLLDAGVLSGVALSHSKCVKTLSTLKSSLNKDRIFSRFFRLSLHSCDLSRESTITLLNTTIDRVKYLTLSNCAINATRCALLAAGLRYASLLLDLDLSGNSIIGINIHRDDVIGVPDFSGLQTLFVTLASNTPIKCLNLSQNHLGGIRCFMSADAPAMGSSLRTTVTTTMQAIDDCGDVSTKLIVDFLRSATSMERLNISANGFKDDTDGVLANVLLEAVGRAGKSATTVDTSEDHREINVTQKNVIKKQHIALGTQTASASSSNSDNSSGSGSCNVGSDIDNADADGDSSSSGSCKRRRKLMNELQPMSSCRSLCGLRPTSSSAHVVTYSQFSSHLDTNDCIDASDREWTAFDGHLLAAETCFDDPSISTLDLSYNHNFGNQGLIHLGRGLDKQSAHLSKLILRNVGLDLANSNVTDNSSPFVALLTSSDSARQFGVFSSSTLANHLCTLILCDNPAFGDNGVQALCHALLVSRVSTLRVLDLAETGITATGVKDLATLLLHPSDDEENRKMFHVSNSLQELDLSRNPLKCKGVADLCTIGLMHNSTLTSLYLVQVGMKMEGPDSLALVLANSSVCKLQHLSVSCNRMCGDRAKKTFNPQSVHTLLDALHGERPEENLMMMGCNSIPLVPYQKNEHLRSIDFSQSDIGARSAKKLFEVLIENPRITFVDITECNITEQGATSVGEALPSFKGLKKLRLGNNAIGPLGCEKLFFGLGANQSLVWLDAPSNCLTGYESTEDSAFEYSLAAVQAIALAIGVNTTLQYLNISNNNLFNVTRNNSKNTAMSFEALDYLKHGIQENGKNYGHLHTLNLTRNPLRLTMNSLLSSPQTPTDVADMLRNEAAQSLADVMRAHPYLGRAHASCFCGVYPAHDPIGERGIITSLAGKPPALSTVLLTQPKDGDSCPHPKARYDHVSGADVRLADQGVEELALLFLCHEVKHSHSIRSLDLDYNNIDAAGKQALAQAIRSSVSLRYFSCADQRQGAVKLTTADKGLEKAADAQLVAAKKESFNYRVAIAVFVRGTSDRLGPLVQGTVLDCLLGPGPQVSRFLRCRGRMASTI